MIPASAIARSSISRWRPWAEYALALVVVVAALALRWLLDPLTGDAVPFLTVFAALLVLVTVVRPGPFMVAAAAALLGTLVLFIEPRLSMTTAGRRELLQVVMFGLAGGAAGLATWLSHRAQSLHRRTEQRLAERGEELRLVTDALPALVSYIDAEFRYRFVNARYTEWFGQPADDLIGRHLREVLGDVAFERVQPYAESALAGRRCWFEETLRYQTAGVRHVAAEYVPDVGAGGAVIGFYALVTDISDRKRAEAAQARLAAIVAASSDAMMSIGLDGEIQTWNAGAEHLYGYSASEAVGQSIDFILPPERAEAERTIIERARRGELVGPHDTVRCTKDGREIAVSVTVSPIRDPSGAIIGVSKADRDITEHKRAEQALRDADRRKDEFLATLAHELRNPLAAVRSATELLVRSSYERREQLEHTIAVVQRQVLLMVRLIDDLLDVSRISHGTLELRTERTLLISLIDQAIDAARPSIERKGHRLEVEAPSELLEVEGDAVRLVQVFTNILSNACKYTDPGGRIGVRVFRDRGDAVIEIRDDGTGIPSDKLDAIFEMFSQLDTGRSKGGLGIGLALSRRLVEMHGGSATAASEGVGRGSTIIVRLPAIPAVAPERSLPPSSTVARFASGSHPARKVLIVDDNEDAADSLALLLSALGHATRTVHDGAGALAEAAAFRPDVILLDLGLPDIDGFDVCRAVRAEPWGTGVLVVALSGWGQERDKRRTAEAGFDAHLTKPADLADVTSLLARAADG